RAIVAVGSSPCICDHRSTLIGPSPYFSRKIARSSTERPISSTVHRLPAACFFTKGRISRCLNLLCVNAFSSCKEKALIKSSFVNITVHLLTLDPIQGWYPDVHPYGL